MILKNWHVPLLLLFPVGLVPIFLGHLGTGTPGAAAAAATPTPKRFERVQVERVVDGDTLHGRVDWPEPATGTADRRVYRLLGVDTPETVFPGRPVQRCGPEASNFLTLLLPAGIMVWAETDARETDIYGRRLVYLWKGPMLVNAKLIREGWSPAYVKYPFKHSELFLRLEEDAKRDKLGLWSKTGCVAVR